MDERFESAFAIYHQRYSTNTFPQWWLAQPFRMLAHNGEINTLKGNVNWMKSHEIRMASNTPSATWPRTSSRSSRGHVGLRRAGCGVRGAGAVGPLGADGQDHAGARGLVQDHGRHAQGLADMYAYCNAVMEPWDGPAALAMTDGRWVCGGLDRNGLRPMRYVVTGDGLLIAGSEAGMVPVDETTVREKGALGPGQMIAVDMAEGKLYHDTEIKDRWPPPSPWRLDREGRRPERLLRDVPEKRAVRRAPTCAAARSRPATRSRNWSRSWPRWPRTARKWSPRWATTRPPRCCRTVYRPLSHFFRQNFSQVTNPPIDSLRESRVMSLKTRFGNLKNVLDENSSQTEILVLESPFIANAEFDVMVRQFGRQVAFIDCTFAVGRGWTPCARGWNASAPRPRMPCGRARHLVLTDEHQGRRPVAMPMILATSAVHSWLTRKGLRTFCSSTCGRPNASTRITSPC
jgi:glutamate synthase (NADPH) large chain